MRGGPAAARAFQEVEQPQGKPVPGVQDRDRRQVPVAGWWSPTPSAIAMVRTIPTSPSTSGVSEAMRAPTVPADYRPPGDRRATVITIAPAHDCHSRLVLRHRCDRSCAAGYRWLQDSGPHEDEVDSDSPMSRRNGS